MDLIEQKERFVLVAQRPLQLPELLDVLVVETHPAPKLVRVDHDEQFATNLVVEASQ